MGDWRDLYPAKWASLFWIRVPFCCLRKYPPNRGLLRRFWAKDCLETASHNIGVAVFAF
jgi:hypothetical protein